MGTDEIAIRIPNDNDSLGPAETAALNAAALCERTQAAASILQEASVMNEQELSAGNVHLIVELTATEDKHIELGRRIASLAQASRREDGVLRYDVVQDATDKNIFRFIECWVDNAALVSHQATEHVASFSQDASSLLAKPYTMLTGTLLQE